MGEGEIGILNELMKRVAARSAVAGRDEELVSAGDGNIHRAGFRAGRVEAEGCDKAGRRTDDIDKALVRDFLAINYHEKGFESGDRRGRARELNGSQVLIRGQAVAQDAARRHQDVHEPSIGEVKDNVFDPGQRQQRAKVDGGNRRGGAVTRGHFGSHMVGAGSDLGEVVGSVRGSEQEGVRRRIPVAVVVEVEKDAGPHNGSFAQAGLIDAVIIAVQELPSADGGAFVGNPGDRGGDRGGVFPAIVDHVFERIFDIHHRGGVIDEGAIGIEGNEPLGRLPDQAGGEGLRQIGVAVVGDHAVGGEGDGEPDGRAAHRVIVRRSRGLDIGERVDAEIGDDDGAAADGHDPRGLGVERIGTHAGGRSQRQSFSIGGDIQLKVSQRAGDVLPDRDGELRGEDVGRVVVKGDQVVGDVVADVQPVPEGIEDQPAELGSQGPDHGGNGRVGVDDPHAGARGHRGAIAVAADGGRGEKEARAQGQAGREGIGGRLVEEDVAGGVGLGEDHRAAVAVAIEPGGGGDVGSADQAAADGNRVGGQGDLTQVPARGAGLPRGEERLAVVEDRHVERAGFGPDAVKRQVGDRPRLRIYLADKRLRGPRLLLGNVQVAAVGSDIEPARADADRERREKLADAGVIALDVAGRGRGIVDAGGAIKNVIDDVRQGGEGIRPGIDRGNRLVRHGIEHEADVVRAVRLAGESVGSGAGGQHARFAGIQRAATVGIEINQLVGRADLSGQRLKQAVGIEIAKHRADDIADQRQPGFERFQSQGSSAALWAEIFLAKVPETARGFARGGHEVSS